MPGQFAVIAQMIGLDLAAGFVSEGVFSATEYAKNYTLGKPNVTMNTLEKYFAAMARSSTDAGAGEVDLGAYTLAEYEELLSKNESEKGVAAFKEVMESDKGRQQAQTYFEYVRRPENLPRTTNVEQLLQQALKQKEKEDPAAYALMMCWNKQALEVMKNMHLAKDENA
ncbi:hypothetical protein FRC07_001867 [Ceratobasidium sp. 392]|nr:hypothetical protein FRC07_001867 [Ceratobasidium sp. 392]